MTRESTRELRARLARQTRQYRELQGTSPKTAFTIDGSLRASGSSTDLGDNVRSAYTRYKAPESGGGGLFSVVPSGVQSALSGGLQQAGRLFSALDKPLSERLGIEIPEMRGPLDEVGNFVLREASRPTTALTAFGGAAAAGRVAAAGFRGSGLLANLLAPAGSTLGGKIASETVLSMAGRAAGEGAAKGAESLGAPRSVQVAAGLIGGALGGAGAIGGMRSGARAAVGKDIFTPPNVLGRELVKIREELQSLTSPDRKGALLRPVGQAELGDDYTIKDALKVGEALNRSVDSQLNRIVLSADRLITDIGKRTRGEWDEATQTFKKSKKGNTYVEDIKRSDGSPALLQELIEFPDRFIMTASQRKAIQDLTLLQRQVADEAIIFGIPHDEVLLKDGQLFFPRETAETAAGEINVRTGSSSKMSLAKDKARKYPDPADGVRHKVVYKDPLLALEAYTKTTLNNASTKHVMDLLVPFSETALTRVSPALRARHVALLNQLGGLRGSIARLDNRIAGIVDAYATSVEPDLDELFEGLKGIKIEKGRNAGLSAAEARTELAEVKKVISQMLPEWRAAVKASRITPQGRRAVGDRAPAMMGRDFVDADAEAIERFYSKGFMPKNQAGDAIRGVNAVQRHLIPMRAIGDASAVLNQLGTILPTNPRLFAKNFLLAARDAFNPKAYQEWMASPATVDAAAHGTVVMGRAGAPAEFQFTGWFARMPVFKQAQMHFESIATRNRVDIYNSLVDVAQKTGRPLSEIDKDAVARSVNRLSGVSNSRAGDVETLTQFAANFMRSNLETIQKAAVDGSLEGSIARQYMRNFFYAGAAMVTSTAYLQGRDVREVTNPLDTRALARGEIRMNPNFGTMRFFGQDIAVYGRFDSLARLSAVTVDAAARAVATRDGMELFDAIGFAATSKGAPIIGLIGEGIKGSTFSGRDPISKENLLLSNIPFTAQGFIEDVEGKWGNVPTAGAGGVINFFGGKASPITPFEKMDEKSLDLYNRPFDELTGEERQRLEATHPSIAKQAKDSTAQRARGGHTPSQARVEFAKVDDERIHDEGQLALAFQSGSLSERQFGEALDKLQYEAAIKKQQTTDTLGIDYGVPSSQAAAALSAWYDTYDLAETAPGVIDFDLRDSLENSLLRRIAAGEFGDPNDAARAIEGRRRALHSPGADRYFEAKDYISDTQYYPVRDEVFFELNHRIPLLREHAITRYSDLEPAISFAVRSGDARKAAILRSLKNTLDGVVSQRRTRLRQQDPTLDTALRITGRVSPTSQQ